MRFSDTSSLTGLVEDTDFICGTDSTSYPLKDKARNMNRWYYKAVCWLWKAEGTWEFDDIDKTDLPIATTTLVDNQQDYSLPTSVTGSLEGDTTGGAILKILRIEVKDSSGNFQLLKQIDRTEIGVALTEYEETKGLPHSYDIFANSLFLYPPPSSSSVTLAAGLKIYFSREPDVFISTDTLKEAGFAEPFHRIISFGASYDWLLLNGTREKVSSVRAEIEQLRVDLEQFYGDRNRDKKVKIQPRRENYR